MNEAHDPVPGIILIDATQSPPELEGQMDSILGDLPWGCRSIAFLGEPQAATTVADRFAARLEERGVRSLAVTTRQDLENQLALSMKWIAYLPAEEKYHPPAVEDLKSGVMAIMPWPIWGSYPYKDRDNLPTTRGWLMTTELFREFPATVTLCEFDLLQVYETLQTLDLFPLWLSPRPADLEDEPIEDSVVQTPVLNADSRILTLIPHFACEDYLADALRSLEQQTRPPDAVAVIHDGPSTPPIEICRQFPNVGLYQSAEQVGPYRLIQSMIDQTDFDGYLFQDADDWSSVDRVELLLKRAEQTGAELVGTQEIRFKMDQQIGVRRFPLNADRETKIRNHPLLHPTSLMAKSLNTRLGGFATGFRFGGDTEFVYRACFVSRVRNIPEIAYYRRLRPNSLTTSESTGFQSEARQTQLAQMRASKAENMKRRERGEPLDLAPCSLREEVEIRCLEPAEVEI